jgi:hypothetical protein
MRQFIPVVAAIWALLGPGTVVHADQPLAKLLTPTPSVFPYNSLSVTNAGVIPSGASTSKTPVLPGPTVTNLALPGVTVIPTPGQHVTFSYNFDPGFVIHTPAKSCDLLMNIYPHAGVPPQQSNWKMFPIIRAFDRMAANPAPVYIVPNEKTHN